jgi:diguanylate cyclase (GGDEF)-like protein
VSVSQVSVTPVGIGAGQDLARGRIRFVLPSSWTLWTLPARAIAYILAVDTIAITVVAIELIRVPVDRSTLLPFALLMVCSVVYTEASRPIEQIREHYASTPHIDLNSVWMFAGVLLLHPALSAVVITTSYAYRWFRVRHHVVYRQTFSAAATVIAAYVAATLLKLLDGSFGDAPRTVLTFLVVAGAGAVFLVVNTVFIAMAIALTIDRPRLQAVLGGPSDYALEAATIALGVLLAWAIVDWPIAVLLIVGVTLVLHRNVLIRQLREKARIDAKTGLLNAAAWTAAVDSELERAARLEQSIGVLVIDLDRFKAINDKYGHLAGDEMLRAVANTLTNEVRTYDLVGRFGGEEFVVLLPGTSQTETLHVAERIRRRVAELVIPISISANGNGNGSGNGAASTALFNRLTVSIGIAGYPDHGQDRSDLLHAADMAMYAAKAAGRNRVQQAVTIR